MDKAITDLVTGSDENLDAFLTLMESEESVYSRLVRKLNGELSRAVPEGWRLGDELKPDRSKDSHYTWRHLKLEALGLSIGFGFGRADHQDCFFGFNATDSNGQSQAVPEALRKEFSERFGEAQTNEYWPLWAWHKERNWTRSAWIHVQSGECARGLAEMLEEFASMALGTGPNY